jgi:hypothetical protein
MLSIPTVATQLWSRRSRPYLLACLLQRSVASSIYINALSTGELLPRSGDFSGAAHFTPLQHLLQPLDIGVFQLFKHWH